MKVVMILIVMGDHMMIEGPLKEEGYQGQSARPLDRRNNQDRGYSGRGYTNQDGGPPG